MSEVEVRLARADELPAVGEVTLAAYAPYVPAGSEYADELRDARARAAGAEIYVAVAEDRVVGTVTGCPPGSRWRELAREDEGEFRMLAVDPAWAGRGIGEALVRRVLERAREHGARGMVLCSMAEMAPAHRLYERLGFVRDPARDWSPVPGVALLAFMLDLAATTPAEQPAPERPTPGQEDDPWRSAPRA